MVKKRVFELARDLGVESKALVTKLNDLGIDVKNHMCTLEDGDIEKVLPHVKRASGPNQERASQEGRPFRGGQSGEQRQVRPEEQRNRPPRNDGRRPEHAGRPDGMRQEGATPAGARIGAPRNQEGGPRPQGTGPRPGGPGGPRPQGVGPRPGGPGGPRPQGAGPRPGGPGGTSSSGSRPKTWWSRRPSSSGSRSKTRWSRRPSSSRSRPKTRWSRWSSSSRSRSKTRWSRRPLVPKERAQDPAVQEALVLKEQAQDPVVQPVLEEDRGKVENIQDLPEVLDPFLSQPFLSHLILLNRQKKMDDKDMLTTNKPQKTKIIATMINQM
ncbi:translation initiation factor IF-2 [Heliorestis convoluta]|uniref:Translation initiation factor IF-2 n=1 Tax=Heliorestis convoluta TaxID=356322 RepID=A0A5Q2N7H5_9FIRM|nr:translation initiation factor IF-2 [Heliorestis convoluta]